MGKTGILVLFLVRAVLSPAWAGSGHAGPFSGYRYISPLPSSSGHNPETIITLRYGPEIDGNSIHRGMISLRGERSGNHEVSVELAGDDRTLLIIPDRRFTWDERVVFRLDGEIRTRDGRALPSLGFWFGIRESRPRVKDLAGPPGSGELLGPPLKSDPEVPEVSILKSEDPAGGYIFSTFNGQDFGILYAFDNYGTGIFYRKFAYPVNNFRPHPSGILTYHDYELDGYVALDRQYQPVDTFLMANGYMANMHEFVLLANGHALMLAYDYRQMDLSEIIEGGDSNALVVGFVIQELDENRDLLFQWRSWDHLEISGTYEECKSNFLNRFTICDFAHANSLDMDSDTSLILSTRNLSEVTRINKKTGKIIWRMGGKNNEFAFPDDPRAFRGQHTASRQANGNITLLDNGYKSDSLFTRGLEYRLDEEQKTASLALEYIHDPRVYGFAMGNLQRLENGHTLIYWGAFTDESSGPVTEYDAEGRVVFEAAFEHTSLPSYRCYRGQWNPGVFSLDADSVHFIQTTCGLPSAANVGIKNNTGEEVAVNKLISRSGFFFPGESLPFVLGAGESRTLELNFRSDSAGTYRDVLTFCYDTDSSRVSVQLPVTAEVKAAAGVPGTRNNSLSIKPVPVYDLLEIFSEKPIRKLELYDIRGRKLASRSGNGVHQSLPMESFKTGIYLLNLHYRDGSISRSRIVKCR